MARKKFPLFRKKAAPPPQKQVSIKRQAADGIITFAKSWHPNEAILILQGKKKDNTITIEGLVVPPFSSNGPYFSGFSDFFLPFDSSYIGMAHSHPGASNKPSLEDLNHFFGLVSVIISFPYEYETIGAFDRNGDSMPVTIVD